MREEEDYTWGEAGSSMNVPEIGALFWAQIDGKLAKLIKEKEDELQATVAESMKELRSLEATGESESDCADVQVMLPAQRWQIHSAFEDLPPRCCDLVASQHNCRARRACSG